MRLWDVLALKISRKYWEGEGDVNLQSYPKKDEVVKLSWIFFKKILF